ncbi:MAG TPA: peptidoglycan DD-metalloendopeptidase family protein [Dehalococcoidia bacterium]|nr:peptidoglycan DD-metalloendopeptidase family protein [Dehalococcoidia bacterium]
MAAEPGVAGARRGLSDHPLTRRGLLSATAAAAGAGFLDRLLHFPAARAQQAPPGATTATVNSSDGLNLRGGPGENYPVLAVMPAGAQVPITGAATPDNWLPVQYNGQNGWADGVYLASAAAPAQTAASVLPADGLNLRSGPGTDQSVIIVIPGGSTVTILGAASNGWVPVSYGSRAGWVEASYLGSGAAAPTAAPATGSTLTAAATASTAGATIAPLGAAAAGSTTAFGTAALGVAAPPERGLAATPAPAGAAGRFVWPVDSRQITTVFQAAHQALDIGQPLNSPARAIADAIVSFAGGDASRSYGLYVILQHPDGYSSLYAHLSTIGVQQSLAVKQGQAIGRTGITGRSTGPHIHFPIYYQGMPLDPLTVLPNDGVQIMAGANDVA